MKADYMYCLVKDECIHRRGCRRWVGNYSEEEVHKLYSENRFVSEVDFVECIRDEDKEDKYGNWIPTAYNMLDRFRYSDGTEMKKCENCKYKDGVRGGLIHCSYFEQFMPTEICKCDIWESKDAGII